MSDGKWSGRGPNRNWARPGSRHYDDGMTAAEQHALYTEHAAESFWCETCHGTHPLSEHRRCRNPEEAPSAP